MRVLHVIPSVGPARGGPSVAVRLMADVCVRAGVTVDVATTNDNDRSLLAVPLGQRSEENGAGYYYFARDYYPYTISFGLGRWLEAHSADYDVVHIHALFSHASTTAARSALAAHTPYILRPLGTLSAYGLTQHRLLKRVSWRLFEKSMIQRAAAVHFTSAAEAAEAASLTTGPRAWVIPLGIDTDAFVDARDKTWLKQRAPQLNQQTVFLFLSRVHPKKQLELVLHALALLRERGESAALVVAGDGEPDYVSALKRLAGELRIDSAVFWAGHLSEADKRAVLRAVDAFVLPSINENFGISVVEALASGLPVVITRGVAIHREVADARAGLVVGDTSAELATAMGELCRADARAALAQNARPLTQRAFSLSALQAGLMQLYGRFKA